MGRWGTGETLRGTWLVQDRIPDEEEEPGLNPAVSSELEPWLPPGFPGAVGWEVGCVVLLCMDKAWGGGGVRSRQPTDALGSFV